LEEKGKNKLQVKKPFYPNKLRKNSLAAATGRAALRPTCPSPLVVRKVRAHGTCYCMPTQKLLKFAWLQGLADMNVHVSIAHHLSMVAHHFTSPWLLGGLLVCMQGSLLLTLIVCSIQLDLALDNAAL